MISQNSDTLFATLDNVEAGLLDKLEEHKILPDDFIQDLYFDWLFYRALPLYQNNKLDEELDKLLEHFKEFHIATPDKR